MADLGMFLLGFGFTVGANMLLARSPLAVSMETFVLLQVGYLLLAIGIAERLERSAVVGGVLLGVVGTVLGEGGMFLTPPRHPS